MQRLSRNHIGNPFLLSQRVSSSHHPRHCRASSNLCYSGRQPQGLSASGRHVVPLTKSTKNKNKSIPWVWNTVDWSSY
ncbi:hypothetical protein KSP40_PGU008617 [Platanthera guangdongensis]|uniref:Uncharacterized protein n=1 Tax=Platanthera guangdongensis TaxID=2320717 RepID=A0ABR2N1F4_9ASPA